MEDTRIAVPMTCEECGRQVPVMLEKDEWVDALEAGEFAFGCPGCFRNEPMTIDAERKDMILERLKES